MTTTTTKYFSSYNFEQILNIKFDPTFLPVVATSFTLFIFLYKFINPILSNLFIKDYKSFTDAQKIDWSTRYIFSISNDKSKIENFYLELIHRLIHLLLERFVYIWWLQIMVLMPIHLCRNNLNINLDRIFVVFLDTKVIY